MYITGIDIGKNHHEASIVSDTGKQIGRSFRFGQFTTTSMADEDILSLRQLCRYRDSVISSRTEIKLRICTIMEQIFPEYKKQFSSLFRSTSMGILEKYLTSENITDSPLDELFAIIKDKRVC